MFSSAYLELKEGNVSLSLSFLINRIGALALSNSPTSVRFNKLQKENGYDRDVIKC